MALQGIGLASFQWEGRGPTPAEVAYFDKKFRDGWGWYSEYVPEGHPRLKAYNIVLEYRLCKDGEPDEVVGYSGQGCQRAFCEPAVAAMEIAASYNAVRHLKVGDRVQDQFHYWGTVTALPTIPPFTEEVERSVLSVTIERDNGRPSLDGSPWTCQANRLRVVQKQ